MLIIIIKNLYYVLSVFFEYCHKFYDFDKTVISDIGCFKKKYEKDNYDFYSLKEFKHFIKYVEDEIYKQFFNLLFFTGARSGEALGLTFNDLVNGYIIINKTMESHGNRAITTPKTVFSNRNVLIDKVLENELLNLKDIYIKKYNCFNDDFFIFGVIKPLPP